MENIFDFSPQKLEALLLQWGEPAYRAIQIIAAGWTPGRRHFMSASTLTKTLRAKLDDHFNIPQPLKPIHKTTDTDGTIKALFEISTGIHIESVAIPKNNRLTYCLSTQAGCGMGCVFCATSQLGLIRNLTPGEIIAQIHALNAITGRKPSNLVFMGMGEPLHNLAAVRDTLELMTHPKAMNWSPSKSMVSTCGFIPGIQEITKQPLHAKLALSLNAVTNEIRSQLMPINRRYPLEVLLPAIRDYSQATGQTVSIEYILIKGINDRIEDALLLGKLLKNYNVKINLIPYNHISNTIYHPPSEAVVTAFLNSVRKSKLVTTLRISRGRNIQAACGQLAGQPNRSKL
ncbi:23S rRNA (adenine(2503)-C(2))-methyltransferase RlmN [bacterium]|nr:23S rRNA (adenine(2503)-C(2))-methyltransferase RlmN [bacterium]